MTNEINFHRKDGSILSFPEGAESIVLRESLEGFTDIDFGRFSSLRKLQLMAPVDSCRDLSFLKTAPRLEEVYLNAFSNLDDFSGLASCSLLKVLGLGERTRFDLKVLRSLGIETLKSSSPHVTGVETLHNLSNLKRLDLANLRIRDIKDVLAPNMERLRLWDCELLITNGFANLPNLRHLDLGLSRISDATGVAEAATLKWLGLEGISNLKSIGFVEDLHLEYLVIAGLGEIESLIPIQKTETLLELSASGTRFSDNRIEFLVSLPALRRCSLVSDYRPIIESLTNPPPVGLHIEQAGLILFL